MARDLFVRSLDAMMEDALADCRVRKASWSSSSSRGKKVKLKRLRMLKARKKQP